MPIKRETGARRDASAGRGEKTSARGETIHTGYMYLYGTYLYADKYIINSVG